MRIKSLMAAAIFAVATATSASAVTVNVGGTKYDVSAISTSFTANETLLTNQIWWGDYKLAAQFAKAVKGLLNKPNFSADGGPLFAHQIYSGLIFSRYYKFSSATTATAGQSPSAVRAYAVATVAAVPIPAAGLLLLAAFGPLAALKRRKKAAA